MSTRPYGWSSLHVRLPANFAIDARRSGSVVPILWAGRLRPYQYLGASERVIADGYWTSSSPLVQRVLVQGVLYHSVSAPVEEVLLGVAVAELQQRVTGGEAQHVRRHRRAGPQEHDPALVLPQRRVSARKSP